MKKAGIDTDGPKTSSFIESETDLDMESESELESGNSKANTSFESQVEAELGLKSENKAENEEASEEQEVKEKDEFDDDDAVIPEAKPEAKKKSSMLRKQPEAKKEKIPYVFAEVAAKNVAKDPAASPAAAAGANKFDKSILYNPPADKFADQKMSKIKILRENTMRQLQKNYVWSPAKSERQNEGFSKIKYQQGNKNADLFVSFLGYIRDTSYKQSPPLFEKIKKKFIK